MTLVATNPVYIPGTLNVSPTTPAFTSALIDASGEKVAFVGRHWNASHTTKAVRRVGFRFGTITKSNGSTLTVSLQDVLTSGGTPIAPDESQDETVAIANADASFASNTWYRTGTLSADRSVAFGEMLSVVIEYNSFVAGDSVNITGLGYGSTVVQDTFSQFVLKSGAGPTWANIAALSNVILEYDDGTFGTIGNQALPASALTGTSINTGTTPDEMALKFQLPFACKIDGCSLIIGTASTSRDFDIVLYDASSNVLATTSIDANFMTNVSGTQGTAALAETALSANTVYYLAIKPTTVNSDTFYDFTVSDANHLSTIWGGINWHLATRTDAGSWTPVTTRRPYLGIRISALDDGAGGAASLMAMNAVGASFSRRTSLIGY